MARGKPTGRGLGKTKSLNYRVPVATVDRLDQIAALEGLSRASTARQMQEWCIQQYERRIGLRDLLRSKVPKAIVKELSPEEEEKEYRGAS